MTPLEDSRSESYILSVISPPNSSSHVQAVLQIKSWIREKKIRIVERKKKNNSGDDNMLIASATNSNSGDGNIFIASATFESTSKDDAVQGTESYKEFMTAFQEMKFKWRENYGCDVNCCSSMLSEWWKSSSNKNCLFIFDLDSTLIQMETIDEMARMAGKYDLVAVF
jgi:hypothetical protein